jgi:single-stranded-DNA-specific exonuclease
VTHMAEAVARVRAAIDASRDILIFGDYDVDGVTSTVFLLDVMRRWACARASRCPPPGGGLRTEHGRAGPRARGRLPGLVICLDCGTNSVAEVAWCVRAEWTSSSSTITSPRRSCPMGL